MLPALSEHLPAEPDAGAPALAALPADRLVEMLGTGDPAVKRAAIDEMARRRDRALLARLGECLSDPHPEIYRYARAKLSQIHEEFEGSLMDALAEIKCRPASPRAHALLVRLLTAHQDTGLVDESLEEYFTEQVAAEAQKIMLLAPGDLSPRVHLARICLKRGQPMEALLQFKALLEHDDRNLEARFGVVEALYDLAEHEEMAREIRTLLATAFTDGGADGRLMDAARWWLLPDEPSPALEEVPQ